MAPDFTRLVMLSDFFDMTLDELVKDIDVQEVRENSLTNEKIDSIYRVSQDVNSVFQNKTLKYTIKVVKWFGKDDRHLRYPAKFPAHIEPAAIRQIDIHQK